MSKEFQPYTVKQLFDILKIELDLNRGHLPVFMTMENHEEIPIAWVAYETCDHRGNETTERILIS